MQVFVKYWILKRSGIFCFMIFLEIFVEFFNIFKCGRNCLLDNVFVNKMVNRNCKASQCCKSACCFQPSEAHFSCFQKRPQRVTCNFNLFSVLNVAFCDSGFFISSSSKAEQALLSFSRTLRLSPLYFLIISASSGFIAGIVAV